MIQTFAVIVTFVNIALSIQNENVVEILNGRIRGSAHRDHLSFESIPYAEPPIGEHRFESPKPYLHKWSNIRDGTKTSHEKCLQLFTEDLTTEGTEDCLFLNVYTPSLEANKSYPVVFFIHGGSFMIGYDGLLGHARMMNFQNLVLVTFNYRLGPLGFLSTQDDQIAGNMGLKDQSLALKWVKQNIERFNGNSSQIVLAGWSAGGASVHYHLLNTETENIVNAAVSFSGTALCPWALDKNPLNKTYQLANKLNCPVSDHKELKDCLKSLPAENIVRGSEIFQKFLTFPVTFFMPVIESSQVIDGFLRDHPEQIIKDGRVAKVPWLVPYTAQEAGTLTVQLLLKNTNLKLNIDIFNEKFDELLPIMLFYHDDANNQNHTNELRIKYKLPEVITEKEYRLIQDMFSKELFSNGIEKSIMLQQEYVPIFTYIYDNPPKFGILNFIARQPENIFGTCHGDDVFLIFESHIQKFFPLTETERELSGNFVRMLYDFGITQIPTFSRIPLTANTGHSVAFDFLNISTNQISFGRKSFLD